MEHVTIYGTKMCSKCKVAEAVMNRDLVGIAEITKVEPTNDKVDEFVKAGFSSMPVIEWKGNYFSGSTIAQVNEFVAKVKSGDDSASAVETDSDNGCESCNF